MPAPSIRQRLLAALFLAAWAGAAAAGPRVVASIAPVHGLVSAVMAEVGEPALLVQGYASPHAYQMRPSDAAALAEADLVFWVGEALESFLAGPLERLAGDARRVSLMHAPGVRLLEARAAGLLEEGGGEAHGGHHHHDVDPHVWLSPGNARAMTAAIASALAEADPGNATRYRRNARAADARLQALDADLAHLLAPVAGRPFVVFHDAYQYLEARYGLEAVGAISTGPEKLPGLRRMQALRRVLKREDVRCVLAERQVESPLVEALAEGTGVRRGRLDPLGAAIQPPEERYFRMMRENAEAIARCLGAGP